MQALLLLALDGAVVDGLADRLQVVRIPEQTLIATMRALVVHYWAVRVWALAAEDGAGALAGVSLDALSAVRD